MKTIDKPITVIEKVNVVTFQDFLDFLKKKGVLRKFIANTLLHSSLSYNPLRPLQDYWERKSRDRFEGKSFMSAFIWFNTPEGSQFWKDLDNDFNFWCEKNNIREVDGTVYGDEK